MTHKVLETDVIRDAVMLACRAPSLHNSQPWRWVAECQQLQLFADREELLPTIDPSGRELLLSCGAVLDHLRVAMAAVGWEATIERFPDPGKADFLAALRFTPQAVTDADRERAGAILRRRTDRLPFAEPRSWDALEQRLRGRLDDGAVMLSVISDDAREQLAEASRLTEAIRQNDPSYQSELRWWTSPFDLDHGVPPSSRVSASEARRVDVARGFPTTGYEDRRAAIGADHSKILVLSTHGDTGPEVLRCGEALSAVLLDCTIAGMATCTLTHMTEVTPARELIQRLTGQPGLPHLLIRVGRIPRVEPHPPATPRRPLSDVLELRR
ncbi:Acg family FMN-binding oxidoreductase [Mycobacterium noviomagense]|uniref:NAD(P)H nitroreductase n=1 Tax=Mycobacterium noviomagense TaxID=459858 RepID=A0A7I7PHX0_9MYCO|nr:NAD(P)H nitroreductase [Mycobacterium noviomagense]ORB11210.1 NAD(P)H nitroreductase [Mycobacterium noviomagense]BBY08238.1 putative NAD(P)H nitroreductase acg [Mycobacterium noviomagense]